MPMWSRPCGHKISYTLYASECTTYTVHVQIGTKHTTHLEEGDDEVLEGEVQGTLDLLMELLNSGCLILNYVQWF